MKINFRQGIVSHQVGFLALNAGNVELLATNRSTVISVAHKNSNYTFVENSSLTGLDAPWGPINIGTTYWLYWDFNPITFDRSFGFTDLEPIAQSVEPGSGDADLINVVAGDAGIGYFVVGGHYVMQQGRQFTINGSTGNDGTYTVDTSTFNGTSGETTITTFQNIVDPTVNGTLSSDIIFNTNTAVYEPAKQDGRSWYNTSTNVHYVYDTAGTTWREVIRVFASKVLNGNTITPYTINGTYVGTQIGDTNSAQTGRVVYTEGSKPIRKTDGTFFTTEDPFFAHSTTSNIGSVVDSIRLESNMSTVQINDQSNVAAYKVIAMTGDGVASIANYNHTGTTVVGIITNDVTTLHPTATVLFQGLITNTDWDWSSVPVGSPLWISADDTGTIVSLDPHVDNAVANPVGQVPVARVLSQDTILFEQGLGGVGPQGPTGSIENLPPASDFELGAVVLSEPSATPTFPVVVGDNDPRLFDARTPLPHSHNATTIAFSPTGNISSTTMQLAIQELDNEKVAKAGDTMTGPLVLSAAPSANLHATTKQYVDSLVSGFTWLDPICMINLISDTVNSPPGTPEYSDAYIVPPGSSGAWAGITGGNIVVWDGATWIDRGSLSSLNPAGARLGVSLTSSTPASGSFLGQDNSIAVFNASEVLTGFETPVSNTAVYVCNNSSLHAFNQYIFNGTDWILFGGGASVSADGITITQTGSVLSVKQFSAGGEIDAKFIQGQELSDLDTRYILATGSVAAVNVSAAPYAASPDWGTPINPASLSSTDVQAALNELMDEKASKTPLYTDLVDLPPAANVHGMIAHVHNEGKAYMAHGGNWVAISVNDGTIQDHAHRIPYDLSYFIAGTVLPNEILGSFVATRDIDIATNAPGSVAVAEVAPSGPAVTLPIIRNGFNIGSVVFATGSTVGVITISVLTLTPGQTLQIKSTAATTDPSFKNITINIVGCADAISCL